MIDVHSSYMMTSLEKVEKEWGIQLGACSSQRTDRPGRWQDQQATTGARNRTLSLGKVKSRRGVRGSHRMVPFLGDRSFWTLEDFQARGAAEHTGDPEEPGVGRVGLPR